MGENKIKITSSLEKKTLNPHSFKASDTNRASENEYFRMLAEQIPLGIVLIASDGTFLYMNKKFKELFGYEPADIPNGMTWFRKAYPDKNYRHKVISAWIEDQNQIDTGENMHRIFTVTCKDNTQKIIHFIPVRSEKGIEIMCCRDITEEETLKEKLEESEKKYRNIFENAIEGIFQSTPEGRYINANPALAHMFGYQSSEELIAGVTNIATQCYANPEDRETFKKSIEKDGFIKGFECKRKCKDGSFLWTSVNAHAVRDEKGKTLYFEGTVEDITEKKQKEEELARLAKQWGIVFEAVKDAIWILDRDSVIIKLNSSSEHLFNLTSDELLGKHCWEIVHGTDSPIPECPIIKAQKSLKRETIEFQKNDAFYLAIVDPILDENGRWVGAVLIFSDITKQKLAEEALKESEIRYRTLFEHANDAIFLLKGDTFIECNPKTLEIFKCSKDRIIGQPPYRFSPPTQPDGRDSQEKALEKIRAALSGKPQFFEWVHCHLDGTPFPAEVSLNRLEIGDEVYLQAIVRDITERKKTEEQLLQAQKMEAIGRLAGGIAHDFNNMLTVIIGHAQLGLLDLDTTHPLYQRLEEIQKAGQRSAELTKNLLAFARKQTIKPILIDVNKAIEDMLKMLRHLIGENIELLWIPCDKTWPMKIDPSQLNQIIINLVINAKDSIIDKGTITIETDNITIDEIYCAHHLGFIPGDYVLLSISDNGIGMEKELLKHIFEPFFTTKTKEVGSGLGLSTVYGIIKQNHGFINVYSEPGNGSIFKIYIPRSVESNAETHTIVKRETQKSKGETILVVEDEKEVLELCRYMLKELGYTVLTAQTPQDAIKEIQTFEGEIHLLITDVIMPQMNGKELAKRLKTMRPSLECLYMSGYTPNHIIHNGVLDDGVYYIQKPFSVYSFSKKIREVLKKH